MNHTGISLVAAGLVAIAVWVAQGRPKTNAPQATEGPKLGSRAPAVEGQPGAESNRDVRALAKQVELLQGQMAQLRAEASHSVTPSEPSSHGTETEPVGRPDIERQREEWHAHMAEIASAFESEDIVAAFANQMTSKIRDAFVNTDSLRGLEPKVECRARTCRVSLSGEGSKDVASAAHVLQREPELSMAQFDWIRETNRPPVAVVYLTRAEGTSVVR